MDVEIQMTESPCVQNIAYDSNGQPDGISVEAWMDKLGDKLIAFYGENFRSILNQARSERGLSPL
jgi:hypothetical protein